MDPVPVGFVIFLVSPAGNAVGVGDEKGSEGGLWPLTSERFDFRRPPFFRRRTEGLVIVVRGLGEFEQLCKQLFGSFKLHRQASGFEADTSGKIRDLTIERIRRNG